MSAEKVVFMLVDDEVHITEILKDGIEAFDLGEAIEFNSPTEALKFVQKNTHLRICMITDYKMPKMNGLELIQNSNQVHSKIKYIMLSGMLNEKITQQLDSEKIPYLPKPISISKVIQTIQTVLRGEELSLFTS
ncbi:MAG TPA: response regulator [Candidatus Gracilibacteria bacterium]|nr:response regulator [Candidatus Gracilibacteria bacterium]